MQDSASRPVGRDVETDVLIERLDTALSGRGGVVLVSGEPGIGKTRLAENLVLRARERGAGVLWGRCYENEGAPALWPWLQVLRAQVAGADDSTLRADLGAGAATIALVAPEIRTRLAGLPDPPALDPADARFRLFEAIANLLGRIAMRRPLLVVLDDLHWSDPASLLLIEFLATAVATLPVLICATYRDTHLRPGDPLARSLGELARRPNVSRLRLGGLESSAVAALVASVTGGPVAIELADRLRERTEGNPFFVIEIARLGVEHGRSDHARVAADGADLPETIRDVIGRRLSSHGADALNTLALAAVLGRDFDLGVLLQTSELTPDRVLAAIEEAEVARLVVQSGVPAAYRFSHALVRESIYADLPAARRMQLHCRAGEAIAAVYAGRLDQHAAALATHYRLAGVAVPAGTAIVYACRAAEAAAAVFAWEEAVTHYETALAMPGGADPATRLPLLLALGEALLPVGAARRVLDEVAPAALALVEAAGDADQAWRVCDLALRASIRYGAVFIASSLEYRRWVDLAEHYARPDSVQCVHSDLARSMLLALTAQEAGARALRERALDLARRLEDATALTTAAMRVIDAPSPPGQWRRHLVLAREFAARRAPPGMLAPHGQILFRGGCLFLDAGERDRAEDAWRELERMAADTRDPVLLLYASWAEAIRRTLDGDLRGALAASEEMIAEGDARGGPIRARRFALIAAARARLYSGLGEETLALLMETRRLEGSADQEGFEELALATLAHTGAHQAARAQLEMLLRRFEGGSQPAETPTNTLLAALEAAVLLEQRSGTALLAKELAESADRATGDFVLTSIARHLGAAAALLGDRAAARALTQQALAVATRIRFRPEMALARLQLAELLMAEANAGPDGALPPAQVLELRGEVRAHLDTVIAELRTMGMQPALARAIVLQERLEAGQNRPPRPAYPDGLSAREVEVLALLAAGKSNRDIAEQLVVSIRTVEHHIARIYTKIGARGRVEATAYALRHGLLSQSDATEPQ